MSDPWWPDGYDYPAFRVKRQAYGINEGGDYVRGSAGGHDGDVEGEIITLPRTALRYPTKAFDPTAVAAADKGIMFASAFDYSTVEVQWAWPKSVEDKFQEVAVVRSTFGAPADPGQGEVVFRAKRSALPPMTLTDGTTKLAPPLIIYDQPLVPGHWYYYTAFFRMGPYDWTAMMSDQCLLPKNYHHADHLWNTLPPWYQYTDDTYLKDKGFLRRFLTIFGFEQDRVREYVESLLQLHWADRSPMLLLRHLGANYGYPYEAGIGDIRYRALLANLSQLLLKRGTSGGLLGLVETVSKYDCDITMGANTTLLPDDSNFVTGTGHWAPIHPDVNLEDPAEGDFLVWDKVRLTWQKPGLVPVPAETPAALGTMLVNTDPADIADIFLVAGAGKLHSPPDDDREFVPYYSGIPVDPAEVYGFSFWVKMAAPSEVTGYLLFFNDTGQISAVSVGDEASPGVVASLPIVPDADTWTEVPMNAMVPHDGHYMVPAIYFADRDMTGATTVSPPITVAAVMVYKIDSDAPVSIQAPDRYLTLGDPNEKMGATTETYEGFTLGAPETRQAIATGDVATREGGFFFSNSFRERLFADPTLMDGMTIKVSLLRSAPSLTDVDDSWRDAETLADLTALTGFVEVAGISGYPLTAELTVSTLPIEIPATSPTRYNHYVMFNTAYEFAELNEPAQVEAIAVEEVDAGGNKLIFVSNTPTGDQTNLDPGDKLTANPDSNLPDAANRWLFSWSDPITGQTTLDPVEGLLALNRAAPDFEASNTAHIWLYPSRANMIANPSFEALGMNYWAGPGATRVRDARFMPDIEAEVATKDDLLDEAATVGEFYVTLNDDHVWEYLGPDPNDALTKWKDHGLPSTGSFAGNFTGTAPFAIESNVWATRQGDTDHSLWTLQLLAKGVGQLKLGLIGWDADLRGVIVDWGTETWDLYPDAWIHVVAVRNCPDAHEAMMRIEVDGTEVTIDQVLAERGALREWRYFDGDSTFALQDSYSWYGPQRRGASYSMWYDMRRAVMGRLFATPVDTIYPGDVLSDAEVAQAGMVYRWVPAGVTVIPHIDVFYPDDLRSPPINNVGTDTLGYYPDDPNGVPNPWV